MNGHRIYVRSVFLLGLAFMVGCETPIGRACVEIGEAFVGAVPDLSGRQRTFLRTTIQQSYIACVYIERQAHEADRLRAETEVARIQEKLSDKDREVLAKRNVKIAVPVDDEGGYMLADAETLELVEPNKVYKPDERQVQETKTKGKFGRLDDYDVVFVS